MATPSSPSGPAPTARSLPSGWRALAPTAPGWPATCAVAAIGLSRSTAPTGGCAASAARPTRSTPRTPPRAVLAGTATATPKRADGTVEMLRQLKITRDTAVKARTQAIITLKALVVTAPTDLREPLDGLSKMALIDRCAGLRPGPVTTPTAAAKHALRALARRWLALTEEIKAHDQLLQTLTTQHAPQLVAQFGIGSDTAAELLVLAGDNPERIRSEAAFAKLCGACPVPASSGKTVRHRLNRGGHRQANAALYRVVIVRMRFHQPTIDYVTRRTAEGKSKAEIIRCVKRFLARELYHLIQPSAHDQAAHHPA
jgi:transposase